MLFLIPFHYSLMSTFWDTPMCQFLEILFLLGRCRVQTESIFISINNLVRADYVDYVIITILSSAVFPKWLRFCTLQVKPQLAISLSRFNSTLMMFFPACTVILTMQNTAVL